MSDILGFEVYSKIIHERIDYLSSFRYISNTNDSQIKPKKQTMEYIDVTDEDGNTSKMLKVPTVDAMKKIIKLREDLIKCGAISE